jgi:hypothetical protein
VSAIAETADTSPERAIAKVRALLGADSDLVIAALAGAPFPLDESARRGARTPRRARTYPAHDRREIRWQILR